MKFFFLIVVLGAGLVRTEASEKPVIYVPVLPYQFLFEEIGGDLFEIRSIVGEGDDPHDYSPTPKQLAQMSKARLMFSGGLEFESNFFIKVGDGVSAPKAVDLLEGIDLLEGSCHLCSSNEEGHDHDHEDLKDPHVWLSPVILGDIADRVAVFLKQEVDDTGDAVIDDNLAELKGQLDEVHEKVGADLKGEKGVKFYVYHGAFAYFAQAYGLEQVAIEVGGKKPTPKQLASIVKRAKEDEVKVVFVQPQFDQSSAKSLAEAIDGVVVELDPLEKDVISNLQKISAAIESSDRE